MKQVDSIQITRIIGGFTVGIGGHNPTHIAVTVKDVLRLVEDALTNGRPVHPWEIGLPTAGPQIEGES